MEFATAVSVVSDDATVLRLMLHYIFQTFHLATNVISWGISRLHIIHMGISKILHWVFDS